MGVDNGRHPVVIEGVSPEIDCGRFPIKRTVGEPVVVEADIFADGHVELGCDLLYRREGDESWQARRMRPLGNDRWRAEFTVTELGTCRYTLRGWVDRFAGWRRDLEKRVQAGQDVTVEMQIGARLIAEAAGRARGPDAERLGTAARAVGGSGPIADRTRAALDEDLAALVLKHPDLRFATTYEKELQVTVDRERARFSTWYELFPRSCATESGRHGTFRDLEARLDYIASMGFDVVYLPPIHSIGRTYRKGKNNAVSAGPNEPGSPWGIGGPEGGHKAIHPDLGTLQDFRRVVARARALNMEIALDVAYQCSPDHPYVKEHPEWFRHRPDGTIQYAENPPKKYQDIYPIEFDSEHWYELWQELKSVIEYWADQGVRIFRVDNPHTKPFRFWEWLIAEVRRDNSDVIFLAEAFTRPRLMYRLAKLGFTQSYTYFTWRNNKQELTEYFTELTQTPVREFFRPNLWPNTPDILHEYLQHGGRPAFVIRLVLAATLGASYGMYGPAFELGVHRPRERGSEEYLDSEKYEVKLWDLDRPDSLREVIARVNRIRRDNPALQTDRTLRFHHMDNDRLICYSKQSPDGANAVVVVVNLDPHHTQSGWAHLNLGALGLPNDQPYQVHDLLGGASYLWQGSHNYVELNPHVVPAHVFRVGRR